MSKGILIGSIFFLLGVVPATAQVVHEELIETVRAEVVSIESESEREIMGTDTTAVVQEVTARIKGGELEGQVVSFENDLVVLEEGDAIFINRLVAIDGTEYFLFKDVDRRWVLGTLAFILIGMLLVFAGKQGVRAMASLAASIIAIFFLLVPALLAGYSPVLASVTIAGVILALVLFLTHGIDARSVSAFLGTFGAVAITGVCALFFVHAARLTGFGSDASVYLNFSTQGTLDFAGLLLGSIIIGILGVLDDVSITQASVVQELKSANSAFTFKDLYQRAIRVGRDHVASLVNTLAFAYVGVSLPLVLLLARTDAPLGMMINQEVVAAELVRIIIGSIGLVLAVPLTTLIASWWFGRMTGEVHAPKHGGHTH